MDRNEVILEIGQDNSSRGFWNSAFAIYLVTILFGIIALAIIDTILNRYNGVSGSSLTLFPSDTPVGIYQLNCRAPIIGNHYFGDFQAEYCRMRGVTPYSRNDPSWYFPGFYVLLSSISLLPSVIHSWILVITLSILFLIFAVKTQIRGKRAFVISTGLLTAFNPFWQTIDRGNFTWLLGVGLIIIGARTELRSHRSWLYAVGISLKIQLAPFLILLTCGGSIREKLRSLANFASIFCLLNFILPLIGWRDFNNFYRNYFTTLQGNAIQKNYSLDYGFKAIIYFVTQINSQQYFWSIYLLFVFGLSVCLVLINQIDRMAYQNDGKAEILQTSLFASSMIVLCSPLSYVYTLMVLLVPTILIIGTRTKIRLINKVQLVLITICILPNTVPLDLFIGRHFQKLNDNNNLPSLGNLVPSLLLPSVALSAVLISFINRRQIQMKN